MLELKEICASVGPVQVLTNVCLKVAEGETVTLVGRNGAGKTTTIRTIMNLTNLRSGTIQFKGHILNKLETQKIANLGIGYAPEDRKIFPDHSVADNIKLSMWISPTAKKGDGYDIEKMIYEDIFPELNKLKGRRGRYLSGGEQKMLTLARALALRPSLLLLDEPLEGLAPIVIARMADSINRIRKIGISILLADSNIKRVAELSDRLYFIERGEIVFEGDPKAALENEQVLKIIRGF